MVSAPSAGVNHSLDSGVTPTAQKLLQLQDSPLDGAGAGGIWDIPGLPRTFSLTHVANNAVQEAAQQYL